jgi:tetratricopeptide (TPR) repeat protein
VRRIVGAFVAFGCSIAAIWLASLAGGAAAVGAGVGLTGLVGVIYLWLPRSAHRAFRDGDFARARRLYWVVGALRVTRAAVQAARLSRTACDLALGRYTAALDGLEAIGVDGLDESARAVWHNNMAYALARMGTRPDEAMSAATAALELRPQVAGFRHTRGVALLAAGKIDEAIRELDAVWTTGDAEATGLLEAERCVDLGRAWLAKGEVEYALDYFARARRAAPETSWAEEAQKHLARSGGAAPSGAAIEGLI